MLKKTVLALALLMITVHLEAQILHIPQTLKYLNKILLGNKKLDVEGVEFYQTLKLEDNGNLILKYIDSDHSIEMNVDDLLVDLVAAKGNWFRVRSRETGIIVNNLKTNIKSVRRLERIYINDTDEATKNRFAVAFKYLIELIREQKRDVANRIEIANKVDIKMQPRLVNLGEKDHVIIDVNEEDEKYTLKVNVCGINKQFILDATEYASTISQATEKDFIKKRIINRRNYLRTVLYKYKNGNVRMSRQIIVPSIKLGDFEVLNSRFFIAEDDSSDLTLGKSFLNAFGEWEIKKKSRKEKVLVLKIK